MDRPLLVQEFDQVKVGRGKGQIPKDVFARIPTTWTASTGRNPSGAFEFGPDWLKPTNWIGTIAVDGWSMQVVPKGARDLDQGDRERLDRNIGEILTVALRDPALPLGDGTIHVASNRFERAVEALCQTLISARRQSIVRSYVSRTALSRSSRGRIRFPQQSLAEARHPGMLACEWVELDESVPENRFLKHCLAIFRPRVHGQLRRQVEELLAEFDHVDLTSNPEFEWSRIRMERLPRRYVESLEIAHELLAGKGAGFFAGDLSGGTEVVFMPDLFETFVAHAVRELAQEHGFRSFSKTSGRHLGRWIGGPAAGQPSVELKTDSEIWEHSGSGPIVVVDAKWKSLKTTPEALNVASADAYQMFAYGSALRCSRLALVYPWMGVQAPFSDAPVLRVGSEPSTVDVAISTLPMLAASISDMVSKLGRDLGMNSTARRMSVAAA